MKKSILKTGQAEDVLSIEWVAPLGQEDVEPFFVDIDSFNEKEVYCSFRLSGDEYTVVIPVSAFEKSNVAIEIGTSLVLRGCKMQGCIKTWMEKWKSPVIDMQRLCPSCRETSSIEDWIRDGTQCPVCGGIIE